MIQDPHPNILFVVSDEPEPLFDEMLALPAIDPPFERVRCQSLAEVAVLKIQFGHTVVLFRVKNLDHLKSLLGFTREYRQALNDRAIAIIAVNSIDHVQIPQLLAKMGCEEIIFRRSARSRSLKVRVERKFKSLERANNNGIEQEIIIYPAVPLDGDCWLFRGPDDAHKHGGNWSIDLLGPGPSAGGWTRIAATPEYKPPPGQGLWVWNPKVIRGRPFGDIQGNWVFSGKKPEFKDYHWIFTSETPQLSYFLGNQSIAHRFTLENGELAITANSEMAQARWLEIRTSVLQEYNLDADEAAVFNPFAINDTRTDGTAWRDFLSLNEKEDAAQQKIFDQVERALSLAPNKDLFTRIKDQTIRESYFKELAQNPSVAIIWARGQKLKISAQVDGYVPESRELNLRLSPGLLPADLLTVMKNAAVFRFFINISLQRASLFFVVPLKDWHPQGETLSLRVPDAIYEVQRRSFFRLELAGLPGLMATVDGRPYKITNLSAGGMAFSAQNADPEDLRIGQKIYYLRFQLNAEEIQCSAEVRWSRPGDRIGVQFIGLPPAEQQRINLYVLEESFDYLVRSLGRGRGV